MTPLHRSRSFWFGLAGVVLISAVWVHSVLWQSLLLFERRDGEQMVVLKSGSGACSFVHSRLGYPRTDGSLKGDFLSEATPANERAWFGPVVVSRDETEEGFVASEGEPDLLWSSPSQIDTRIQVPYWLLLLAWCLLWSLLLWRRRLAAAMAMPEDRQG
jgi:hypothetical protein